MDHIGTDASTPNPQKCKKLRKCTRRGSLFYGVVITAIWTVLVNMSNPEFEHFKYRNVNEENGEDWSVVVCVGLCTA